MGRRGISELHHHERRALQLLRAPRGGDTIDAGADGGLDRDFAALRAEAIAQDCHIWQNGARLVSTDEMLLLTWVATLQRRLSLAPSGLSPALLGALDRCAAGLSRAGVQLPYRAIARATRLPDPQAYDRAAAPETAFRSQRPMIDAPHRRLSQVRARALDLLRAKPMLSTREFTASGISRQSLSNMCKAGYLERIHAGWYRIGGRSAATAT